MHRRSVAARLFLAMSSCALATGVLATAALASETVAYSYDALGRLVGTTSSGTVNNGLTTNIGYDPAGNRQSYGVTGAGTGTGSGGSGGGGGVATVPDASFENPPLNGGYTYNPVVPGATFSGSAGIAANGSAWGFPATLDGSQAAFLQGAASIALSVSGLTPGASYAVRFWTAPRPSTGGTPVTLSFGGAPLGTFTPSAAAVTSGAFTATAPTGTLTFSTSANVDVSSAIDAVTIVPMPSVADGSFESPAMGSGYQYNPTPAGATFTGAAGVAGNGSAWGFEAAPDGNQVGFVQSSSVANSSISLAVSGLVPGATYQVRFAVAQRPGYGTNPVTVAFAGTRLGTYTPASSAFAQVSTSTFTATAASGTLTFTGAALPGDIASALDAVAVVPAP